MCVHNHTANIMSFKNLRALYCRLGCAGDAKPCALHRSLVLLTSALLHFSPSRDVLNTQEEADWKKQSAETFLASMDRMGADNAL